MAKRDYTIWRNDNYEEWLEYAKTSGEYEESEINYDTFADECNIFFNDELDNLDEQVDGVIVAFASLGLWNGRRNGAKIVGDNVKDILKSSCGDYVHFYCDRWNALCEDAHHDGTNYYTYRVAKDRETAERLVNKIAYEGMTREQFMRSTKSLRHYIANTYGW